MGGGWARQHCPSPTLKPDCLTTCFYKLLFETDISLSSPPPPPPPPPSPVAGIVRRLGNHINFYIE